MSDGSQASLLNLVGTVPVISQQNQGRVIEVPLEICLPLHYPMELPIIWIRPNFLDSSKSKISSASGVVVLRQTENVDGNGKVWGIEGLRGLRLFEIIVNLQNIFGYHLPIVSSSVLVQEEQEYLRDSGIVGQRQRNQSPINTSNTHTQVAQVSVSSNNHVNYHVLKEKVVKEIEKRLKTFDEEICKLNEMKTKLFEGETVLNREKMTMNNEVNLLNKEIDALEMKRTEMERFISNNSGEMSQRSATTPSDPASSQLLELLANESALMDALYHLIKVTVTPVNGENRVPLNTALRCIRELSRKHFLTKAHIRKIT